MATRTEEQAERERGEAQNVTPRADAEERRRKQNEAREHNRALAEEAHRRKQEQDAAERETPEQKAERHRAEGRAQRTEAGWQVRHFEFSDLGASKAQGWHLWRATDTRELPGRHRDRVRRYAIRRTDEGWLVHNGDNGQRYLVAVADTPFGGFATCTCPGGQRPRQNTSTAPGVCVHVDLLNAELARRHEQDERDAHEQREQEKAELKRQIGDLRRRLRQLDKAG